MKKALLFLLAMVALLVVVLMFSPVNLFTDRFKDEAAQSVGQSVKATSNSISQKLADTGKALTPSRVPRLNELDERLLLAAKDLIELPTEVNKQKLCDVTEEVVVYTESVWLDPLDDEEYALSYKIWEKAFGFRSDCLPLTAE